MTAAQTIAERHDAQVALNRRPRTLADAGRAITAEHKAMRDLLEVAEDDIRRGVASPDLRAAAIAVREAGWR